jgi:hypothetical protein
MKKFFKALALVLALVLVIGTIPVSADTADFSLKRTKKIIYLGGASGEKEVDGAIVKCKTKDNYKISRLVKGFDSDTMDITLESSDPSIVSVSSKKDRVYAEKIGKAKVTININDKGGAPLGKLTVTVQVKKNASALTYYVVDENGNVPELGADDQGNVFVKAGANVKYIVTLPRKYEGQFVDTDYRELTCEDPSVSIEPANDYGTKYAVTFTKGGDFVLKAATYQSKKFPVRQNVANVPVHVGFEAKDIRQKSLDTVVVTFDSVISGLVPENFKAFYYVYDTKNNKYERVEYSPVSKVEYKDTLPELEDNQIALTFYSPFDFGETYYVEYDGQVNTTLKDPNGDINDKLIGKFTAVTVTQDSVVRVEIVPGQEFSKGDEGTLAYKFYDKDDIDITLAEILYSYTPSFEFVTMPDKDDYNSYVEFAEPGKAKILLNELGTYKIKCTYQWYDANSVEKSISGGENTVVNCALISWKLEGVTGVVKSGTGTNYLVVNGNGNSIQSWVGSDLWAYGDGDYYVQIAAKFTKNGKTAYEGFGPVLVDEVDTLEGPKLYTDYIIQSANDNIVMVADEHDQNKDGWVRVVANSVGSTNLIVKGIYQDENYNDVEKAIGVIPVTVKPARVPTRIEADKNTTKINLAYAPDTAEYHVQLLDQYDAPMYFVNGEAVTFTVTQVGWKADTGIQIDGFDEGVLTNVIPSTWADGWHWVDTLVIDETNVDYAESLKEIKDKDGNVDPLYRKSDTIRLRFSWNGKITKEVSQLLVGYEDEAKSYYPIFAGSGTSATLDTAIHALTGIKTVTTTLMGKTKNGFNYYGPDQSYTFANDKPNTYKNKNLTEFDADNNKVKYIYTVSKDGKLLDQTAADEIINFYQDANTFVAVRKNSTASGAAINAKAASDDAVKLAKGTYEIRAYKLTVNGDGTDPEKGVKSTLLGSPIRLVVSDNQEKAVIAKKLNAEKLDGVGNGDVFDAFNVSFNVIRDGWNNYTIQPWEWTVAGDTITAENGAYTLVFNLRKGNTTKVNQLNEAYIQSATLYIKNATVGNIAVTTNIGTIVKVKKDLYD